VSRRSKEQREQDRADLLAALAEAELPITAPALVAQARGYTLESIPDRVLDLALRRASTDLRALARSGALVLNTPGFVATYTRVDLPGSEMAGRLAESRDQWEDEAEVRRMVSRWEEADA
jgi:hypothetical protein